MLRRISYKTLKEIKDKTKGNKISFITTTGCVKTPTKIPPTLSRDTRKCSFNDVDRLDLVTEPLIKIISRSFLIKNKLCK